MLLRRVNVFKPGTGTITVWENSGGQRGAVLYQLKGIPLTPGCAAPLPCAATNQRLGSLKLDLRVLVPGR